MDAGPFEEEFTIFVSPAGRGLVCCCAPAGMEREAALTRMNYGERPSRRFVLKADTVELCPDEQGRKHFIMCRSAK